MNTSMNILGVKYEFGPNTSMDISGVKYAFGPSFFYLFGPSVKKFGHSVLRIRSTVPVRYYFVNRKL